MRYNFKRLDGEEWYNTIRSLRGRGLTFRPVTSADLYNPLVTSNPFEVYYYRTLTKCQIIYYIYDKGTWRKKLRQISFDRKAIDTLKCVLKFKKIANSFNEGVGYEPNNPYTNGIYTYYNKPFKGYVTVLDMNSAYLWALGQPLADWQTKQECSPSDVWSQKYDYYCFENDIMREMFYKKDISGMSGAMLWADVKIYGFTASRHYTKTVEEIYRRKLEEDKEFYKNVANITVGCMHKRSGLQNNTTLAASLYAFFAWYIDDLVARFQKKGYNVIMVTTDSIKIEGDYREEDNLVKIGGGLGEFKVEYKGIGEYISEGHYKEAKVKWKGKPQYMIEGNRRCEFIDNIDRERVIYEKYAVK